MEKTSQENHVRVSLHRLDRECAKLDPMQEKDLAEEGLAEDLEIWPKY